MYRITQILLYFDNVTL